MDGLWPRINLRPGAEVPVYPKDDVDADPSFNKYLAQEEFVEGPDWVPGQIPRKYIPQSTVEARVMPVPTRRRPAPSRPFR